MNGTEFGRGLVRSSHGTHLPLRAGLSLLLLLGQLPSGHFEEGRNQGQSSLIKNKTVRKYLDTHDHPTWSDMQGMWQTAREETPQLFNITLVEHKKYSDTSPWSLAVPPSNLSCTNLHHPSSRSATSSLKRVAKVKPLERVSAAPGRAEGTGWGQQPEQLSGRSMGHLDPSHRDTCTRALRATWSRSSALSPGRGRRAASAEFYITPKLHWGSTVSEGWDELKVKVLLEMSKYTSALGKQVLFWDVWKKQKHLLLWKD